MILSLPIAWLMGNAVLLINVLLCTDLYCNCLLIDAKIINKGLLCLWPIGILEASVIPLVRKYYSDTIAIIPIKRYNVPQGGVDQCL